MLLNSFFRKDGPVGRNANSSSSNVLKRQWIVIVLREVTHSVIQEC